MFSVHITSEKFKNVVFTLKTYHMFSVHITSEKFKNVVFTLKTHHMFSVHTTPEKFENATNIGHCGQENYYTIIVAPSFSKSPIYKMFSVESKAKNLCFQNPPV